MAKLKTKKAAVSAPNKTLHSRVSYLYQAAAYLATRQQKIAETLNKPVNDDEKAVHHSALGIGSLSLSRKLLSDLRSVSLKGQIRLSPEIKHSICKRCDLMLIDGFTCKSEVENKSKQGKKPWADVLVRTCDSCKSQRRFPVLMDRQKRRPYRTSKFSGV
jgi:ribonuclease P protein subunit RPR2